MVQRPAAGARAETKTGVDAGTFAISSADGTVTIAGHACPRKSHSSGFRRKRSWESIRRIGDPRRRRRSWRWSAGRTDAAGPCWRDLLTHRGRFPARRSRLWPSRKRMFEASIVPLRIPRYFSIGTRRSVVLSRTSISSASLSAARCGEHVRSVPRAVGGRADRGAVEPVRVMPPSTVRRRRRRASPRPGHSGLIRGSIRTARATPADASSCAPCPPSPVSQPPIGRHRRVTSSRVCVP